MKAKDQFNQAMEGVAPLYTRVIPYGVYQALYAGDNRMMSQNAVATQYRMTPSAIAWLVTQAILIPRFIVTEDNSPRVIMKLFASSDVDFVASMRALKGWDYAGLSEYWRGRVGELEQRLAYPSVTWDVDKQLDAMMNNPNWQTEYAVRPPVSITESERVALATNYYRQAKLDEDK